MKILIIKLSALGDVLRTTSILQGLDETYPHAEIYWITKKNAVHLLKNIYIDNVLVYSPESISYLKTQNFDLVINLDEDFEACSLASSIKTKRISGLYLKDNQITPTPSAQDYFNMSALGKKPENDILKKKNTKTYQQHMLNIIGIKTNNYDTLLYLSPEQKRFAIDFARRFNINKDDLVIGVNTGAADRWPKSLSVEKTASLIEKLYDDYKAKIILFGGPNEIERNNRIMASAKAPIVHTGCGNDLFEFPAIASLCNLFITSDSLGLHISLALKRKTIALFGPTSASEIEMYGLGNKIISKSKCYCCYKSTCTAMNDMEVKDILTEVKSLLKPYSVSIIITSFKEPNVKRAIDSFLNQNIGYDNEIIVVAPDKETEELVKSYHNSRLKFFKDPGKGKSYALNLVLRDIKSDIIISTDGDVYTSKETVNEIVKMFNDPIVGVVGGRPFPQEPRDNMWGYFSHLLFYGAHRVRQEGSLNGFLECSGYLFAFRNSIMKEFPLDVAEDTIIPMMFWKKGYRISYAENALVYVKNVSNTKDWLKQKTRTSKAHETLEKYINTRRIVRVKTFSNELKKGILWSSIYFRNLKELYWTFILFFLRLIMWTNVFVDTKFRKKQYRDAWERVATAR